MIRKRPVYAKPIGFLSGRSPNAPLYAPPQEPYPPYPGPDYMPNNYPILPHHGPMFPPGIPQVTQPIPPRNPGFGGFLQHLLGGKGAMDLPSIIANAQKVIGVINQLGSAVRTMSPMLELLKGLSEPDLLEQIEQEKMPTKRKRVKSRPSRRRTIRSSRKRRKRRRAS